MFFFVTPKALIFMVCYLGVWQSATGRNLYSGPLETHKAGTVTTDAHPALHGLQGRVICIILYDIESSNHVYRNDIVQCLALSVLKPVFLTGFLKIYFNFVLNFLDSNASFRNIISR